MIIRNKNSLLAPGSIPVGAVILFLIHTFIQTPPQVLKCIGILTAAKNPDKRRMKNI